MLSYGLGLSYAGRRSERRTPLDRRAGAVSMMFRIVAAFFIVTFAPSASAQPYVGLALGQARYNDACAGAASSISCSSNDTSFRLFGGYKFNRNFSIELGTNTLGTVRASSGESADFDAIDLSALVSLPLANRFAVYGRLGIYAGDTTATSTPAPAVPLGPGTPPPPPPRVGWTSGSSAGLTYGLGASFEMTQNTVLRLEWQRFE